MLFRGRFSWGGRPSPPPADDDLGNALLLDFAAEHEEDRWRLWWTLAAAAVFHGIFLFVTIPEIIWRVKEVPGRSRKVYVVQQVRFRPPAALPQQAQPKKAAKKIPIPDPTPDAPEPLVVEELQVPQIDMLEGLDVTFGIPDSPPGTGAFDGWGDALEVGGDVKAPVKIFAPEPRYTEEARQRRIQGIVILRTVIDEEGNVAAVDDVKGLPLGLTESAIETVRTWKFKPATQNGEPVPVYYLISVNFRLI